MQLNFLQLPLAERQLYFDQAGQRRNLSPIILEKDFWVCWLLGVLFHSTFKDVLVFKGGTSLSKVFAAIERFSEDIDLSVATAFLGIAEPDLSSLSRNKANQWMQQAEAACAAAIQQRLQPALEEVAVQVLGRPADAAWLAFELDPATNSPVLYFRYPTVQPAGFSYLRRAVKLEFGSLTDQRPTGKHAVRPWLADALPQAFADWQCDVVALELERTFWEKATILHAEYHRPLDKLTPDRFSRHYADTAALARRPEIAALVDQDELRRQVVEWKSRFFGSGWANYDQAVPGTFKLVPPDARRSALFTDYEAMRDMYLHEPMSFNNVLATLADLERRINAGQP